ncbi:hypothetical protein, partial [Segatella hominis]|uniref:hypothetical protein n=1 Tax=Segatella hominis TaxID=2518605 RepID=UPI003AB4DB5C
IFFLALHQTKNLEFSKVTCALSGIFPDDMALTRLSVYLYTIVRPGSSSKTKTDRSQAGAWLID